MKTLSGLYENLTETKPMRATSEIEVFSLCGSTEMQRAVFSNTHSVFQILRRDHPWDLEGPILPSQQNNISLKHTHLYEYITFIYIRCFLYFRL